MAGAIEVEGLRDLQRTFRELPKELARSLRKELREVAEPVRMGAETIALRDISHIGPAWSKMRVGAAGGVVYVAPRQRGARRGDQKRPNLAGLLGSAMQTALDEKEPEIIARLELMVDGLIERYG